ncbi:MAG: aldehyde dehydrogenase family protein [Bdellovibrionaceae bacterium]|nr:aldehyde dehydrogenase family protein [Bdellovibrionales bacterium]MCB9083254.1 aldehyde dehydrogenase family protein [Pseudobdellovibrionaceae bacterium]
MSGLTGAGLAVPKTIKLFIDGAFVRTESGRSFPVFEAKSKKLYANLCQASRKDLRNAVTAAQAAQSGWAGRSAYNRSQILYRMAEMAESKRAEFVELLKTTLGYDESSSQAVFDRTLDSFVYYAGFADKYQQLAGSENPVSSPHYNFTCSEPVGVVGLIASESFQLDRLVAQMCAVICSGNSLVVLMEEEGAALLGPLSEVFATSDLPKGVINLLSGYTEELSPIFGDHMEIQSLCYQGTDNQVLAKLREAAAENMKRVATSPEDNLGLENILRFVEFKTVWHPVGS